MSDKIYYDLMLKGKYLLWNKEAYESLCSNERSFHFFKENINNDLVRNKVDWCSICSNHYMIPLIEENFDRLSLQDLSVLFTENKNINDLSSTFFCRALKKAFKTFTHIDDDYDEIEEDDYRDTIIHKIYKKCNKLSLMITIFSQKLGFYLIN